GVYAIGGSHNTQIGGTTVADRNVISGNNNDMIYILSSSDAGIQGNYIGVSSDGTSVVDSGDQASGGDGIVLNAADNALIGGVTGTSPEGAATGAANVIAGQKQTDMLVHSSDNVVI